mmetsp:Transcript_14959/g.24466  ORF Transcript_14959/g.24466 Transcript_14959/m.24466 type:complete len:227 (+) Transcript_14959:1386-2066(+)
MVAASLRDGMIEALRSRRILETVAVWSFTAPRGFWAEVKVHLGHGVLGKAEDIVDGILHRRFNRQQRQVRGTGKTLILLGNDCSHQVPHIPHGCRICLTKPEADIALWSWITQDLAKPYVAIPCVNDALKLTARAVPKVEFIRQLHLSPVTIVSCRSCPQPCIWSLGCGDTAAAKVQASYDDTRKCLNLVLYCGNQLQSSCERLCFIIPFCKEAEATFTAWSEAAP